MSNYIFPPIVDTYQKAFVIGGDEIDDTPAIKIRYSLPPVATSGSIEVSIRNQYNNLSVLKNGQDTITASVGEDYIYILQSEVNVGLNQWYRIQLRYNKNGEYSEWSTITLIKAISAPSIELAPPFAMEDGATSLEVNSQSVTVQGSLKFSNSNDDETLQSYEIELLQEGIIIEKSGVLYPDPFNARAIGPYQLKSTLQFLNNTNYQLKIRYTTKGLYTNEPNIEDGSSVTFTYSKGDPAILTGDFFVTANNNKGYNEIQVGLTAEDITKNKIFKIQRSSYRNNYTTRETIFTIDLNQYKEGYPTATLKCPYDAMKPVTYGFSQVFADTTAEPGILYRYFLVDGQGNDYEYWGGGKNLINLRLFKDKDTKDEVQIDQDKITMPKSTDTRFIKLCKWKDIKNNTSLVISGQQPSRNGTGDQNSTIGLRIYPPQGKPQYAVCWLAFTDQEFKEKLVTWEYSYKNQEKKEKYSEKDLEDDFDVIFAFHPKRGNQADASKFTAEKIQVAVASNSIDYEPYKALSYIECMLDVEHIFFTDINSQFRLNLNPNISNFKYVVQESVTNTLGSAFPFVRRSGHTKYRQFSISGTICGYGDDEGIFLSKNSASLILSQGFYDRYKAKNRIMPWNDYIFEKQYRDKAIEFLMDGKPKLFKSFTEGNMIVALTAVSFTPNKQLDRNVYDFSATVTEIAECTVENCQKYNCYENEAYKMFAPTEYYLVAEWTEQMNDIIAAIQGSWYNGPAKQGFLCVHEVTNMLQAYSPSSELNEILANDSVIRGGTK